MSTFQSIGQELRTTVRLSLLQGFRLDGAGQGTTLPISGQRVVAFLALHERPLLRLYVAGALWMDSSEARALASLRTALWRAQQALGKTVRATPTHLALAADLAVDLCEHRGVIDRVLDDSCRLARADVLALARTGELLPDWYEDWVVIERERLRQVRLHALDAACERLTASGRYADAAVAGSAAVCDDPLRESGQRALIRLHLAEGNVQEAMRQHDRFAQTLHDGLGLRPSALMEQLMQDPRVTSD